MTQTNPNKNKDNIRPRRFRPLIEIVIGFSFFGLIIRAVFTRDTPAFQWSMVEIGPVLFASLLLFITTRKGERLFGESVISEAFGEWLMLELSLVVCLMTFAVLIGIIKFGSSVLGSGINVFADTLALGVLYCGAIMVRTGQLLFKFAPLMHQHSHH